MNDQMPPPLPPPPPEPPFSPYESPRATVTMPSSMTREEAADKLRVPAILMIITASISILMTALGFFSTLFTHLFLGQEFRSAQLEQLEEMRDVYDQAGMSDLLETLTALLGSPMVIWMSLLYNLAMITIYVICLIGGVKMHKVRGYGLAMAACIISSIPCFGSYCCLGMIPGIWGLVLLTKAEFKSVFQ